MMRSIQDQWKKFEAACIPASAPAIQRQEMRRAFYAGAHALLSITYELGASEVTEAAGAAVIQGLHEECALFVQQIQRGEA